MLICNYYFSSGFQTAVFETEENLDVVFGSSCAGRVQENITIYVVNLDPYISRCFHNGTSI